VIAKLSDNLQHYKATPKTKLKNPLTASQEVGWFHDSVKVEQFTKHGKKKCGETVFAGAYYGMKGHSIYSNKVK
jgi:FAM183A and FAM183B related